MAQVLIYTFFEREAEREPCDFRFTEFTKNKT